MISSLCVLYSTTFLSYEDHIPDLGVPSDAANETITVGGQMDDIEFK